MTWTLADSRVVGSMCALRSSAPFGRDAVVLENDAHANVHLIFGRRDSGGHAAGERMTVAEWRDLLACDDVLQLTRPIAVGAAREPKSWLLRASFPDREQAAEQLRASQGAVLHEEARDDVLIFVVDETRARHILERWSRAAFDRAWRLGQRNEWALAHQQADLAWLTDPSLELDRVAMLALAVEVTEGPSAAEDLIAFELNSRPGRPESQLRAFIRGARVLCK